MEFGGNRSGYNESEIGKFYFDNNEMERIKNNLYSIADEMVATCVIEELI